MAVLESGQLASGAVTRELEVTFARDVSHTKYAVAVANGTAALHLALLADNIGPGDEVITTPFTFQATANMILAVGARPVFVDVAEVGNIDATLVEAAITARTRALLPVYLYGRLADMTTLCDIASRHNLAVIEDAAQAHGAEVGGRRAGSIGTGCFSFYATKNVMSGEGGLLTTDDEAVAEHLRRLRAHGESERYNSVEVGYNYRMTDLTSAIALAQVNKLPVFNEARRRNAAYLSAHLRGVILPPEPVEPGAHVWHQYTVRVPEGRDELQAYLRSKDIEAVVYYPRVLPAQPLYRDLGFDENDYPMAQRLAAEVLSLPVHPGLSQSELDQIVEAVNAWTESRAGAKAST
jgi:dTDP-4-amino-4,6-dideoxygalactose transaminase